MPNNNQVLKVSIDEVGLYIIDPSQTIAALNNYHRNLTIQKYLEYSRLQEITLGKKTYKRKEYLTESQFHTLWSLQRQTEKTASDMQIKLTQMETIQRRLRDHGNEMTVKEIGEWTKLCDQLNVAYDLIVKKAERLAFEQRAKALLYCFGIDISVVKSYYRSNMSEFNNLMNIGDGLFISIVNNYDNEDTIGVKDIITSLWDQSVLNSVTNSNTVQAETPASYIDDVKENITKKEQ